MCSFIMDCFVGRMIYLMKVFLNLSFWFVVSIRFLVCCFIIKFKVICSLGWDFFLNENKFIINK